MHTELPYGKVQKILKKQTFELTVSTIEMVSGKAAQTSDFPAWRCF
jgi:hypothetical protein